MAIFGCENRQSCTGLAIIAALIIGIVTAFLRITAVITLTPVFLWTVFGIAIGYLAVTLIATAIADGIGFCSGRTLTVLLAGILGTVLFSVILLGIEFVATSVIGAIIAGLLAASFTLTVVGTACLIRCLAD